jgi:predicted RNA polymerase sigma factor
MLLPTLEDALCGAFLAALRQWPTEGIPLKPEAWLMTAARRRLVDSQRQQATASRAAFSLRQRFNPCTPEDCAQEQSRGQPSWRLALLDAMPTDRLATHQPWWAARASLLDELEQYTLAAKSYQQAIGLCSDPQLREFLRTKLQALLLRSHGCHEHSL